MAPAFRPLGLDHLAALAITAALAALACAVARRQPRAGLAPVLGVSLALAVGAWAGRELWRGGLTPLQLLPLHLCDLALLVAIAALLTRRHWLCEWLYFWAGAASLAMLSPDLPRGYPDRYFLVFFALHAAVVVPAALLTFGYRHHPRPGAAWRVFAFTALYAAAVALVNLALGTNYLFLCRPPTHPTLLDRLGAWPLYIASAAAIGLALFLLLEAPFRLARRRAARRMSA